MNSRERILGRLRAARQPFQDVPPVETTHHVVPLDDISSDALRKRFVQEAEKLSCRVWQLADTDEALAQLLSLLDGDDMIISWDFGCIPLPGLGEALAGADVRVAEPRDAAVRVGLTGVDAAIASTGTLLLTSGPGRPRQASLLPPVHIAVMTQSQIIPDFEAWVARQREAGLEQMQASSNIVLISGPSRTADIAMELIMGVHGPGEVHVLLLPD